MGPNEGDVKVGGVSVQTHPEEIKKHIGYLSDDTGLIELRTKEVTSRPLDQMEDGKKAFLKYLNFLLPLFLIIGIGVFRYQSRRNLRIRRMNENYF